MTETAQNQSDVTRLKSILFRSEQQAIEDMRDQLEAHHERIGSDVVMQESVSAVLAGALRDARVHQHKQVADAIAPILVEGMKREIRNSREEMVDALYPIMGRLVSAYVSSAVNDVMNQTNQRLESSLSGRFIYLRGKALLTGKSYQELALADRQAFRIEQLMLIRRGSGMLIDHLDLNVDGNGSDGEESQDTTLVSGVVAAIHDFAQNAFKGNKSSLRSVDMGEQTIYLRATSGLILAMIGKGRARRKLERALDAELVTLLDERARDIERLEDDTTETAPKILPIVAERLLAFQLDAGQGKPILAMILFGLLGAAIAGFVGWSSFQSWQTARLHNTVASTIDAQTAFSGYPVQINVAEDRSEVRVAGFAPSPEARERLVAALGDALGSTGLDARLNILTTGTGIEKRLKSAEERVAIIASDLGGAVERLDETANRDALRELTFDISRLQKENTVQRREFESRATALQKRIANLEARPVPQVESPLARWVQRNGVFFGEDTTYRNRTRALATLSKLADLLDAENARVRVVGYADVRGRLDANQRLAQKRAETVVNDLVSRGVSSRALIAVGRASERQFSTETGPESGNRRVEFELLFDGE